MRDFDLLDFLSHNYISLGTLANQNMWRSYCYGDPNIWWWHLQEETEMPFGNGSCQFTSNNRYRVSLTLLVFNDIDWMATYYLYIEDLELSKVRVYVAASICARIFSGFLLPNSTLQNLSLEILNTDGNIIHSYAWGNDNVILKGEQLIYDDGYFGLLKSVLIFDRNAALLYLYDHERVYELVLYFLSFSEQSNEIVGMEYDLNEVISTTNATRLAIGLNNTHTYIYNLIDDIRTLKLYKVNNSIVYNAYTPLRDLVKPLSSDFPWTILFFFRPTPVSCSDPSNCNLLLPVKQHFTGRHTPITLWTLESGIQLSANCNEETTYPFIWAAFITSYNGQFFYGDNDHFFYEEGYGFPRGSFTSLIVGPDYNMIYPVETIFLTPAYLIPWPNYDTIYPVGIIGLQSNSAVYIRIHEESTTIQYPCGRKFSSLFPYHNNNAEPLIWLFHYDSSDNSPKSHVIHAENMDDYTYLITDDYIIGNIWGLGVYDQILVESCEIPNIESNLSASNYYAHVTQFFIFNTLAHTAPQVINGSWNYMHYLRFVLDDYTSSNLRIPLAIVEGNIKRDNIKYREILIDKMSTSQRYPIVQLGSLSKAQMPDVVLDGYIASLNADAGKKAASSFGTLVPYYDLKEAKIQEPHPEWYFRIYIHAGTWYYIFRDIISNNNNQMKTYRIQHNDGNLRIILDVGLYFEILTERASEDNKKYTIVYADIFPSVYWCYGNEAYEFLNVNVEWIQCRYSMPGSSMVRFRPNNNIIAIDRSAEI